MVSFERVFEVLDLPVEITSSEEATVLSHDNVDGEIRFDAVSFSYTKTTGDVVVGLEEQKRFGQQWSTGDWRTGTDKKYEQGGGERWAVRFESLFAFQSH
jgi:ATP-binding cassette subfamily B protein